MWTEEHRARQRVFERQRYPTDLTDAEWEAIRPLLPEPAKRGRPPTTGLREVLNALRYLSRAGCGWRMLPHEFGPWPTVYWWFRRLVRRLLFQTIHDIALMLDRERQGREASPSAGVVDSQTVKAPAAAGGGGYDAAKRLKGRKRHVAVDTDGRLLMVNLTTADVQDAAGAEAIIKAIRRRWPWLRHLFADGACDRGRLMSAAARIGTSPSRSCASSRDSRASRRCRAGGWSRGHSAGWYAGAGSCATTNAGLSGISCLGPYDVVEGAIVCRDANSPPFRMTCWTSCWAGLTLGPPWPTVACWTGSRRLWPSGF
jgi:putative transposase